MIQARLDLGDLDQVHADEESGDEWGTPPEIIELARAVLGAIDLDPASNAIVELSAVLVTARSWRP